MLQGILTALGLMQPTNSGDFIYHLSNGAYSVRQVLPDVVEPVVMPMLDAVADYPLTSIFTTAVVGAGLYWQHQYQKKHYLATASGHRMNCGLHSIIHTWLGQDEATIRSQIAHYPIFQEIIKTCLEFYQLPTSDSTNTFLALCNRFSHPRDREILLGQIFRMVLRDYVPLAEIREINDDKYIPDDLLSDLTKNMGAKLTIHNTTEFRSIQRDVSYLPNDGHFTWEINLYHVGGHYDFKLPTYEQCKAHNARMYNTDNAELFEIRNDEQAIKDSISLRVINPSHRSGV